MVRIILGVFLVLHGLVHLLYFAQSRRLFELQPGMVWPDGAWALSKLFGDETTRLPAAISMVLVAVGFVTGGAGVLAGQSWWRPATVGAAALSIALYVLLWDGGLQDLDDKGVFAILINTAILAAILMLGWPNLGY